MVNILILTYYYPPCTGVPSYRPFSWAKDFKQYNFNTTFITRHWKGDEKTWEQFLEDNPSEIHTITGQNSKTIYLPYKKNKYIRFTESKWMQKSGLSKFIHLLLTLSGNFQKEIDAYNCFKNFVFAQLSNEKYDLIIATTPPLNLVKLAYEINKKHNIPFVIDFQDTWNNMMLAQNYKPGTKELFYNYFKKIYLKKWLNKSLFMSVVTPSFNDFIKEISSRPIETITNGFEKNAYNQTTKQSESFFNISLMGTVHPIQDINIMLAGLNLFLADKDSETVKLNFVGLNSVPEVADKIKESLPQKYITVSDRVSMQTAVELTLSAHVLLFPSYKGYKGYYTAKIFEYLGAKRNILMVPGNNDIVDELIIYTNAGKIANTVNEFAAALEDWYIEWKNTGTIKYNGINERINLYSREAQNGLFCEAIKKHLM